MTMNELPPICYAMSQDILEYKVPRVGKHIPGVFDVALHTADQMRAAVLDEREKNVATRAALINLHRAYVRLLENGRDRILMLGGECDPVE